MKKRYSIPAALIGSLTLSYWVYASPPSPPQTFKLSAEAIITMDDAYPKAEAVLVEDGIIAAIGTLADLSETSGAKVIQTPGVITPGFIEPHTHPIASALLGASVDISSFEYDNRADIMEALKVAADQTAFTPWLIAYGWDPVVLPDLHPATPSLMTSHSCRCSERGEPDNLSTSAPSHG